MATNDADTREQLEADIRAWHRDTPFATKPSVQTLLGWLDRQAAITERELCKKCEWPLLAALPDREAYDRIAELEADNERLRDVARKQAESFKGIEEELAKADGTCNTLRASVAGLKGTVERQRDELAEARHAALGVWRALDGLFLSDGAVTKALVDEWRRKLAGAGIEAS